MKYRSEFWARLHRNLAVTFQPEFGFTRRNNTSVYESSLLQSAINNSVIENTCYWALSANGNLTVGPSSQFYASAAYGITNHKLTYLYTDTKDDYTNSFFNCTAGYNYRTQAFSLNVSGGFIAQRNVINGYVSHDLSPRFYTNARWTLSRKSQLSAYIYLQNSTPGIDWRAEDVVRSNEYLYITANPNLKTWQNLQSNLVYNYYLSNALSMSVFGGYDRDFNRVATVYVPYDGGATVLRTYVNDGTYINCYFGVQVNYRLLRN